MWLRSLNGRSTQRIRLEITTTREISDKKNFWPCHHHDDILWLSNLKFIHWLNFHFSFHSRLALVGIYSWILNGPSSCQQHTVQPSQPNLFYLNLKAQPTLCRCRRGNLIVDKIFNFLFLIFETSQRIQIFRKLHNFAGFFFCWASSSRHCVWHDWVFIQILYTTMTMPEEVLEQYQKREDKWNVMKGTREKNMFKVESHISCDGRHLLSIQQILCVNSASITRPPCHHHRRNWLTHKRVMTTRWLFSNK